MAETLVIDGTKVKRRSPTGIWLLTVVTLTVYWYVWYYKINDEARRYLRDDSIRPWRSVLAIFPGFLLLFIPVFVSPTTPADASNEWKCMRASPRASGPFGEWSGSF
jgi:hypothetical protein